MLGFGKRQQELKEAAEGVAKKLFEEALRDDRSRRGLDNEAILEDFAPTMAAWAATALTVWQKAKSGDPDALRQTARNYLFGTGMPINPRKARRWLEAAQFCEMGFDEKKSSIHPFYVNMEKELNRILTAKEQIKEGELALDWFKGLKAKQIRSIQDS